MRNQKVASENVDQQLFETFSALGYDGTSMEILAKATGLKKASLYHRFPNGKKEMAQHVLDNALQWIQESIVKVAANHQIKPETRLKKVVIAIDGMYNGGKNNCLLRTLSIGTDANLFKFPINKCFDMLTESFRDIAIDFGVEPDIATEKAQEVNLQIQGSLVLAGASGDTNYFKKTLSRIPELIKN